VPGEHISLYLAEKLSIHEAGVSLKWNNPAWFFLATKWEFGRMHVFDDFISQCLRFVLLQSLVLD